MMFRIFIVLFFFSVTSVHAMEVYLKNGDKISGTVTGGDTNTLVVQTMAAGEIRVNKAFVDLPKTYPEEYGQSHTGQVTSASGVEWKKDLTIGYTSTGGNTQKESGQLSGKINRKTAGDETTLKLDANYSSANGKIDARKFYGMARYAYSFGDELTWYHFYKMEADQDYFANIYYRLIPSVGVGYWFSDTPDLKVMAELGLGYQYTHYRFSTADNKGEPVLVPRLFIDKRLFANLHLSEDLTFYPSLGDINDYRLRSETSLINQINQRWSWKISFIDDFNASPPPGSKNNDYSWITSLQYHF